MHRDSAAQLLPRAAGSLRYFDLRHTRTHNYAVSFPDMLALQGNTATYLMYSRARLQVGCPRLAPVMPALSASPLARSLRRCAAKQRKRSGLAGAKRCRRSTS